MPRRREPPVQPPEASPTLPGPEVVIDRPIADVAAATPITHLPTAPGKGPTPAAPDTTGMPTFRPPTRGFDPTTFQKVRGNQLDAALVLYPPAVGRTSVIGTGLIGECALANGLGTQEPAKVFVGFSEDNTLVFLMPVGPRASRGVDVTYNKGRAIISLWQAFGDGKSVEEGYRETYGLWRTPVPVTIHETTGWAVYFSMEHREKGRVSSRDADEEERMPKAKKARPNAKAPTSDATETAPTQAAEDAWEEVYDEILADQEKKITDLEARLKAYEERYGKL